MIKRNFQFSIFNFQLKTGFTLIEILIVIAIISMMVALAFPNFFAARQRARDVQRKSDLKQIQKALELAKSDQSPVAYPTSTGNTLPVGCVTPWTNSGGTNTYMPKMPCDPLGPTQYYYNRPGTLNYTLYACLENGSDPDKDSSKQAACSAASYTLNEP